MTTQAARQLVLDLPHRPALEREDFFVCEANAAAVAAIDAWPHWPGPVLVLVGPQGAGKTHLCEVWRARSKACNVAANHLSVTQFDALFAQKAVIVEDLPGDDLDETGLFHLINHAREHAASLLLTARTAPASWDIKLPDLSSRLAAASIAALKEPDDALLRAVLIKQFADRQIAVNEAVISYMLTRMERSAAAACQLVAQIDEAALRQKANVTRPFVAAIMSETDKG